MKFRRKKVKRNDDEKADKKNVSEYKIDLATIEEDGSFQCPKCGMSISPEDESEENYKILDTKVVNEELAELIIAAANAEAQ